MQIVCPECKFTRTVDESQVPARSQVATCPKCQTKFKFRDLPEQDFIIEAPETGTPMDTAAPPKAVETPQAPAPKQEPVLKPFTQEAPVEPVAAPDNPADEPTFPGIPRPTADEDGGLWDRLHTMTPPESAPKTEEAEQPKAERKPPVIGSRYGQSEEQSQPQDQQPVEGWTGEFNEDFPDPMDFQDDDDEDPIEDGHDMQVPPPFEQLDRYGFFSGLFLTIKLLLVSPRLFFSVMPVGNGVTKPLTFAILVALFQTVVQFAWGTAGLTTGLEITPNGFLAVEYSTATGLLEMLLTPAAAAISLYVFTTIYHLILFLLKAGDQGFEGTFRVLAYAHVPMITGFFPMPTTTIQFGWLVLYAVWSLALTAIGFKYVHKSSYMKVLPALIIPLLLGMIFALLAFQVQLPTA